MILTHNHDGKIETGVHSFESHCVATIGNLLDLKREIAMHGSYTLGLLFFFELLFEFIKEQEKEKGQ